MSVSNLISNNGISALSRLDCATIQASGSITAGTSLIGTGTIFSGSSGVNGVFSGFTGRDVFFQSGATSYLQGTTEVKIRTGVSGATEMISGTASRVQINIPLVIASSATNTLRLPGMTTAQRDALVAPAAGMVILNTTTSKLNFYSGVAWEAITSA